MKDIQKIKNLGQIFTQPEIVKKMISLIKNKGIILEPSCGVGNFSNNLACTCIELDKSIAPKNAIIMDFFDYSVKNKFDTIIGNPPYVAYKDILSTTKTKLNSSLFNKRSNLFLFFIEKCIRHLNPNGELIFIVPRELMKLSSAIKLNEWMYSIGTITDLIELGDEKIWTDANPNTIIFRFEKDNFTRICNKTEKYLVKNGQIIITNNKNKIPFSDLFFVKVGGVSGADEIFENINGNLDFVCSYTAKTKKLKKMFYNIKAPELKKYKSQLKKRKINKFDNKNWYKWGRDFYHSTKPRIYVNCKTRNKKPFFYNKCKNYDGSVLAIFPKFNCSIKDIKEIIKLLNNSDWKSQGFMCDGRYLFGQKSLENCLLNNSFKKYLNKKKKPK